MKSLPLWSIVFVAGLSGWVGGVLSGANREDSRLVGGSVATSLGSGGRMVLAGQQGGSQVGSVRVQSAQQLSEIVMVGPTLRIVSQQGVPVAAFAAGAEGGELYLLDAGGQPSVVIQAGSAGQVLVSGRSAGGKLSMGTGQGQPSVELSGAPDSPNVKFSNRGQERASLGAMKGGGGGLMLSSAEGKPLVELLAQAKSGYAALKKSDGKLMAEFDYGTDTAAVLKLFGEKDSHRVQVNGESGVFVFEKGEVKAQLPPAGGQ